MFLALSSLFLGGRALSHHLDKNFSSTLVIRFSKDSLVKKNSTFVTFRFVATNLLKFGEPGSFVVRDSQSYEGAFGLAVKVASPPPSVLQQVNGDISKYKISSHSYIIR